MDDLLALMGDQPDEIQERHTQGVKEVTLAVPGNSAKITVADRTTAIEQRSTGPSKSSLAEASIDARLGIRMLNRKIGSIDLLDLVSANPYFSPAALVKMTTAGLNQLLQDPSRVIDPATVTGRTNLLTIGIVFTNSGTKISKAGRAFSIIEIGNLATGPIVTVLLFGDAYGKVSNLCSPGMVVALLNPSIIPPNQNSSNKDNALSLSVGDQRQLLHVAKAMDYGVCKGTSTFKRHDGRLTDVACKCHVDTRIGPYCTKHGQQGNAVDGKTAKDLSFLQKTRQEMAIQSTNANPLKQNRDVTTIPHSNYVSQQVSATNPFLIKAPKNMVKGQVSLQTKIETPPTKNPYQKAKVNTSTIGFVPRSTIPMQRTFTGNWLKDNTKAKTDNKRLLNRSGTSGFDGGVMVPQAHPMFRVTGRARIQAGSVTETTEDRKQSLLQRQKALSSVLQDKTNQPRSLVDRLKASQPKQRPTTCNTFLADIDIDINAILNAKSRFETEASAEAYARSRKAISELERSEERESQKVAKKTQHQKVKTKVRREWTCVNCKRISAIDPKICKRQGHIVKLKRRIEEARTLTEQRLQLQDKSLEDGGIVLGAGVEWTKYGGN